MLKRKIAAVIFTALIGVTARAQDAQTERAPDTMQARVLACAACHGEKGQGTDNDYFPRLAGKPAGYLYNQLAAFRDGRRQYPPMNYLLAYLPDAYLHRIAEYFAAQRPPYPPAVTAAVSAPLLARGEQLATQGDPAKHIPACAACHGAALTGMEPAIPGLLGLHADYISAQLGAWRYGTRKSLTPDCMHEVASRLTNDDITAVAAWLAASPGAANPAFAPAGSLKMPLRCGSEPQ
ncbi:cytochrome C [Trinickia dabaoshanensis]|uniref:Cytochrome C n=2 Tax=Trinickia dabaoshanensis TaxID=564714 RepID=A0A2N7VCR1_9BURK|nr:c-type cytochrome [Trinickia dabaoshanensis]PMS14925.1 cytochrome C [Trinickia dabaoshanensis]